MGRRRKGEAVLKRMYDTLLKRAARYQKGCLAKLLPPGVTAT